MSTIPRLMLIDDDEDDREICLSVLQTILPEASYIIATNGEDALQKLNNGNASPDLIFLDLNMPLMNGKQFLMSGKKYHFLEGGGELGALTRAFDWSKTVIGACDQWPQALKTTVGIILHSDFPMFLWWGDDMIQFYNDAYRPSLGENGKHPKALGQPARECWPEIWNIIYPLIEQVRTTARSFFSENQLVPIYRNGKIEDV